MAATTVLASGCSGGGSGKAADSTRHKAQPTDTIHTWQNAMAVYGWLPEQALGIIDTAEMVGNVSEFRADLFRMRIYCETQAFSVMDSLLGGPADVRYDSAMAIGRRLLRHDSLNTDLAMQQNVLELMHYSARQKENTDEAIRYARRLVDVCHRQGAETVALRNEAEVGVLLCAQGLKEQGLERLDSVIARLTASEVFKFNEMDALIIASKRKMDVLTGEKRYAETLPMARHIIDLLNDYELHPDQYNDSTYRMPDAAQRAAYIRFYRTQAQGRITAAYAALGQLGSMEEVCSQVEQTVRQATVGEYTACYQALERQMEAERQKVRAERSQLVSVIIGLALAAALAALLWYWRQKRIISRKNRVLVRQMSDAHRLKEEAAKYRQLYEERLRVGETSAKRLSTNGAQESSGMSLAKVAVISADVPAEEDSSGSSGELTDDQVFLQLSDMIVSERLYLDPNCNRQMLIDRLHVSKERIGSAFAKGSSHPSLSAYINNLRLDHAYQLLTAEPDLDLETVALRSGFSSRKYFGERFKLRYGMTLSEFRTSRQKDE